MTVDKPTDAATRDVSLADEDHVRQVLVESVLGLWDVVNNLTRLKPSRRDRYRVTIFGSARVRPGTFAYEETKRAAAALAAMGCDIVTGGGPGLMQAANEGAAAAPEHARSVGIRVTLPFGPSSPGCTSSCWCPTRLSSRRGESEQSSSR